jgi:hypothetical protein
MTGTGLRIHHQQIQSQVNYGQSELMVGKRVAMTHLRVSKDKFCFGIIGTKVKEHVLRVHTSIILIFA